MDIVFNGKSIPLKEDVKSEDMSFSSSDIIFKESDQKKNCVDTFSELNFVTQDVDAGQKNNVNWGNSKWQRPDYFDSTFQECVFVGSCMMSQLLSQSCTPQTLAIMNIISKSFDSNRNNQPWLMASFPLVAGSFILISGRIGDIYGLKWLMIIGNLFFVLWCILSGVSKYSGSDTFFIVSRAFQGLGIAFILPNMMGCVGNIYIPGTHRKNIVIALISGCAPIGAFLGAIFSGLIGTIDENQWPWSFYAMAIASAMNLVAAIYSTPGNIPTNIYGFSMDWIGSGVAIVGLILFNFVWNQGPIAGWNCSYIIVLLIISVIVIIIFFIYEVKYTSSPLLPREVTKNRHMIMVLMALFVGWGSYGIFSYYYFSFILNLRHYSALFAGTTYFMFAIWGCIASVVVGFFIKKVTAAVILFISMVAFVVGCVMLSVTPVDQSYFRMNLGTMIILSFGLDMSFPAAAIILSDDLPMQYQGMAGSLANTMVNYSMSLCLGMGTTIETQINKDGSELLKGYRAAEYLSVGLSGLGCVISMIYLCERIWAQRGKRLEATKIINLS